MFLYFIIIYFNISNQLIKKKVLGMKVGFALKENQLKCKYFAFSLTFIALSTTVDNATNEITIKLNNKYNAVLVQANLGNLDETE